jgi:hypothetical protein
VEDRRRRNREGGQVEGKKSIALMSYIAFLLSICHMNIIIYMFLNLNMWITYFEIYIIST